MNTTWPNIDPESGDWRVSAIRKLLARSVAESSLRCSAVNAALAFGLNPLTFLPSKRLEVLRDFLKHEVEGSFSRITLLQVILKSHESLTSTTARALVSEISKDKTLFFHALRDPHFHLLPGARDLCLAGIGHTSSAISKHAMELLARHWPDASPNLQESLARYITNRNRNLRAAAAHTLGYLSRSEAEERLRKLLQDPERIVRHAALVSLVRVIGPDVSPDLVITLKDSAPLVRVEACMQVANLHDYSLLESVLERSADVSFRVRLAAFGAVAILDRPLALRNLARFSRNGPSRVFLEHIQATDEEYSHFEERADVDIPTEDVSKIKEIVELFEDVTDDGSTCDVQAFLALRYLLIGQLLVSNPLSECLGLVQQQCVELKEGGISGLHKFVNLAITNILARGSLDPKLVRSQLLTQLEGNSHKALAAQALLMGLLEGLDDARHTLPLQLELIRSFNHIDHAFEVIVRFFSRDARSFRWPSFKDEGSQPEDDPHRALANRVQGSLECWSLFRATPRCLGFLLAVGSLESWHKIPQINDLPPQTRNLIETYGEYGRSERVALVVLQRLCLGDLPTNSSEVELLAGMGDLGLQAVCDHGQRGLFFKDGADSVNTASSRFVSPC